MKNKSSIAVVIIILFFGLCYIIGSRALISNKDGIRNVDQIKEDVKEMIKNVYAPERIEKYNSEKSKNKDKMSSFAYAQMFGTGDVESLTERDLQRKIIFNYITYGYPELQYDGKPRVLANFNVKNEAEKTTVNIKIEYILDINEKFKIEEVKISSN